MNDENKLYEKFTWLKQDLIYAGPKGNKAQFKGVALLPTISGNGKKYVTEELHRSARTLVGKPLTLNHNPNKVLGDVTWAEFENDCIEYVAETKNPEYIEKLQDSKRLAKEAYIKKWGRDPIYGVSVEANYRFHDAQCNGGNCTLEPHGIIFNALSLVEDPERPGVSGTTCEIMETQQAEQRLSEMLVKDLVPLNIQSSILEQDTSNKMSKDENGCPDGQHKNDAGECVPDPETPEEENPKTNDDTVEETLLNIKHQIEKTSLKHAKETKTLNESLQKTRKDLSKKLFEVDTAQKTCCNRLGETQKLLLEVEGISKGTLQKLDGFASLADFTDLKESMAASKIAFTESLGQAATKTMLAEAINGLPKIDESIKPLQEAIAKLPNIDVVVKPLQEAIAQVTGKLVEMEKKHDTLNTVYEALERKHTDFVKETQAKKLQETQESNDKLKLLQETVDKMGKTITEQKDEIDTLRLHVPPNFKAKVEPPKVEPNFSPPYSYQTP